MARAQRLLDAGLSPHEVIDKLSGDLPALDALDAELPSWVTAQSDGQPQPVVDDALGAHSTAEGSA